MSEAFFERQSYSLRLGTNQVIRGFCENYPDLFENPSHFVRCALEREFRRLRREGKTSQKV